jgi:hypothetical protein
MRQARIALYSVSAEDSDAISFLYEDFRKGVESARQAEAADLALKVLVTQSGGLIMGPDNDLAGQINRCIANVSDFYTLSFDPLRAAHSNEYHDLKVLIDKPGLTARTSSGYYNQP